MRLLLCALFLILAAPTASALPAGADDVWAAVGGHAPAGDLEERLDGLPLPSLAARGDPLPRCGGAEPSGRALGKGPGFPDVPCLRHEPVAVPPRPEPPAPIPTGTPLPSLPLVAAATVVEARAPEPLPPPTLAPEDGPRATAPDPPPVHAAAVPDTASPPVGAPLLWVAAAGVSLLLPLWVLYRRLARHQALVNATRAAVLAELRARPGATVGEIARAAAIDRRTASHHLTVLREFGFAVSRPVGARLRWFENGGHPPAQQVALAALRSPTARLVADAARGGRGLAEVARATGLPKSTAKWHLDRLRALGVVSAEPSSPAPGLRPACAP